MNILQLLKQKFSEINKRGGPNKVRGGGKNFRKLISGVGRLLSSKEYLDMLVTITTLALNQMNTIVVRKQLNLSAEHGRKESESSKNLSYA